jgi:hypothetical protein
MTHTEELLKTAIQYADSRWSGVDVPIEWVRHFADALAQQDGQSNFCAQCEAFARELKAVKQEQGEPFGYWFSDDPAVVAYAGSGFFKGSKPPNDAVNIIPLYTTPQQRPWVGLKDEDKYKPDMGKYVYLNGDWRDGYKTGMEYAEAYLKEKNNG